MEKNLKSQIIKNSFWNFVFIIINRIGALIFTIIIARMLLPEAFGIYNLAISIALILITLTDLGINSTLTRYVAEAIGKNQKQEASSIFRYLFRIKFYLTLIASIILLIIAYPISMYLFKKPDLLFPFLISAIYVFFLSFESFFDSLFYAFKKVKFIAMKEILSQSSRIIFAIIISIAVYSSYKVSGIIVGMVLSAIMILILSFFFAKKYSGFIFEKSEFILEKKRIIKFLSYITIGSITAVFFAYIDSIMIGILIPDASYVGYYKAAFSIVFSVAGLLTFVNVLFPVFTQLNKKKLDNLFNRAIKYVSIISIPASLGIVLLGKYIINLIYGAEYSLASLPLYFLAFLIFEMNITWILTILFSSKEKPQLFVNPLLISTGMNILLNYILIKILINVSEIWAMTGAAIATLISRIFYMSVLISRTKRIKISMKASYILKSIFSGLIFFIPLFLFNYYIVKDMNLIIGIGEIIAAILLYFFFMIVFKGITKQEIKELKEAIK